MLSPSLLHRRTCVWPATRPATRSTMTLADSAVISTSGKGSTLWGFRRRRVTLVLYVNYLCFFFKCWVVKVDFFRTSMCIRLRLSFCYFCSFLNSRSFLLILFHHGQTKETKAHALLQILQTTTNKKACIRTTT